MEYLRRMWNSKDLRSKILFTIGIIVLFRFIAHIPVPGVDPAVVQKIYEDDNNSAMQIISALMGGGLSSFSIVLMGLAPYINASIIVQLMTVVIPKLEQWKNEGESGQRKITSLTRWLTLPLAFAQSWGMVWYFTSQGQMDIGINPYVASEIFPAMLTITAGTLLLMWLGELITEKGLGNGISLIIFTGIISTMPGVFARMGFDILELGDTTKILPFLLFVLTTAALLVLVVVVTDANRPIQIVNASRNTTGEQSSLPIRILQAGMIPIIFAISLVTFPSLIAGFFEQASSGWLSSAASWWSRHFNSTSPTAEYLALYAFLIVVFTYFYVSITFNPQKVSENIQKRGGFVPGLRPGRETAEYLGKVSNRMNFWGGLFLAFVALVPLVFTMFTQLTQADLIISGAGLIIVVGVVLELIRQVNAQLVTHNYDKLA